MGVKTAISVLVLIRLTLTVELVAPRTLMLILKISTTSVILGLILKNKFALISSKKSVCDLIKVGIFCCFMTLNL